MFEELCQKDPKELSNLMLAYVGDSVFELYSRLYVLENTKDQMKGIHKKTISIVSAKGQANSIRKILELLTEDEANVFKRGRNTHTSSMSKNASAADYQTATGAEALIGYLFLSKRYDRVKFIINEMIKIALSINEEITE